MVVGIFLGGELLGVGVISGVHADDLDPLDGLHRGIGLEMDVGDNRDFAAELAEFGDDVLQVGRVLHRRRGDAHKLAADGDEFERLPDGQRGVHRVAGEHGLLDDRMIAAHHKAAVRRVADDDLARLAAVIEEWRFAVAHGLFIWREDNRHVPFGVGAACPVAEVEERDVEHEGDQQCGKTGLEEIQNPDAYGPAADDFNQRQ